MTALTVAVAVLFVLVLVLAVLVAALARQIGVLHERVAPAGALMMRGGPKPGESVPEMQLTDLEQRPLTIGGSREDGRHTLVFFLSPTCPVCKTLLPTLQSARRSEERWLEIVLASDGEHGAQVAFVTEARLRDFRYVLSQQLGMTFSIGKLPYAVLIDPQGVLVTGGLVNSREHLESIFNARELASASVQDYLAKTAYDAAGEPPRIAQGPQG
jgi:methylamine dehydrogenase accessory protein MauD